MFKIRRYARFLLKTIPYKFLRRLLDFFEKAQNKKLLSVNRKYLEGWSIVVVSDGKSKERLIQLIHSVEFQCDLNCTEIIVVGPIDNLKDYSSKIKLVLLNYKDQNILPGWITLKKNIGVKNASFSNVVVCHDYIEFLPGWFEGYKKFGTNFDVCMNVILLQDGRRSRDWLAWDYPNLGAGLLPYNIECTNYQYISGTFFVIKKNFYIENPLDERLRWAEGEDVEWSLRIRQKTTFKMNSFSTVKFTKAKPANDAPYCDSWIRTTEKLSRIFSPHNKTNIV